MMWISLLVDVDSMIVSQPQEWCSVNDKTICQKLIMSNLNEILQSRSNFDPILLKVQL